MTDNTQPELPPLGAAKLGLFIAAILLGVASAFLLAAPVFRSTPTDLTRVQVLLNALNDEQAEPGFIIFGNSVARDGLDTRVISAALPGEPIGYNFGSPGQSMAESNLYYNTLCH